MRGLSLQSRRAVDVVGPSEVSIPEPSVSGTIPFVSGFRDLCPRLGPPKRDGGRAGGGPRIDFASFVNKAKKKTVTNPQPAPSPDPPALQEE